MPARPEVVKRERPRVAKAPASRPADAGPTPKKSATPPPRKPIYCASGWCWLAPWPQGNRLYSMWGTRTELYLVGGAGTVLRHDGKQWSAIPAPTNQRLTAIWGAGPRAIVVVGTKGAILRWDGRRWSAATSGVEVDLLGVWGSSADDVYAVGKRGTILHFDGKRWTGQASGTRRDLHGIWGSGPRGVLAVGASGTALWYDGTRWRPLRTGTTRTLRAVGGRGASDVFAVGDGGTITHFDGKRFTRMKAELDQPDHLRAIWGRAGGQVYVAGVTSEPEANAFLRHDGKQWHAVDQSHDASWRAIWGSGPKRIFALGEDGTLHRFDGKSWDNLLFGGMNTVYDISVAKSGGLWGAGVDQFMIYAWTGDGWTEVETDARSRTGWGAVLVGPKDGVYVAARGHLWLARSAEDSGSFDEVGLPDTATAAVNDLWGAATGEVFAACDAGQIYRFNGKQWQVLRSGLRRSLEAIWGSSARDVVAVGWGGAIVHYDGTRLRKVPSPTRRTLKGVWGSGPGAFYAVGERGTILRHDGTRWRPMTSPVKRDLSGIWGAAADDVFAVGARGTILHYDGRAWTPMRAPVSVDLYAVSGRAGEVYVAGEGGALLRRALKQR